jgi:hypothetical protein
MKSSLRMLAPLAMLLSASAFAYDDPGCRSIVWSAEHNHYHCADDAAPPPTVYETVPASGPRVYVGLSYNAGYGYPYYRPWYYRSGFYVRPYFVYAPQYWYGRHWAGRYRLW